MDIYGGLFESMMACCGRIGYRHAPLYTLAMMALGGALILNLLSVIDLLWSFGLVDNPYRWGGGPHAQRYLLGTLYLAFLLNTVLARLKFAADRRGRVPGSAIPGAAIARMAASRAAAPAYVLGSTGLFLITLTMSLRNLL